MALEHSKGNVGFLRRLIPSALGRGTLRLRNQPRIWMAPRAVMATGAGLRLAHSGFAAMSATGKKGFVFPSQAGTHEATREQEY